MNPPSTLTLTHVFIVLFQWTESYHPNSLCYFQTVSLNESYGLQHAHRLISKRLASRVILIPEAESIWKDYDVLTHPNETMMLILGRCSKWKKITTMMEPLCAATFFELIGTAIESGNLPFLDWSSRYVPPYDVGNETTLPPFLFFEDSTIEEHFADSVLRKKYVYTTKTHNVSYSNETYEILPPAEYIEDSVVAVARRLIEEKQALQDEIDEAQNLRRQLVQVKNQVQKEKKQIAALRKSNVKQRAQANRIYGWLQKSNNKFLYGNKVRALNWLRGAYRVGNTNWRRSRYKYSPSAKKIRTTRSKIVKNKTLVVRSKSKTVKTTTVGMPKTTRTKAKKSTKIKPSTKPKRAKTKKKTIKTTPKSTTQKSNTTRGRLTRMTPRTKSDFKKDRHKMKKNLRRIMEQLSRASYLTVSQSPLWDPFSPLVRRTRKPKGTTCTLLYFRTHMEPAEFGASPCGTIINEEGFFENIKPKHHGRGLIWKDPTSTRIYDDEAIH